jgi:hypothetical protein
MPNNTAPLEIAVTIATFYPLYVASIAAKNTNKLAKKLSIPHVRLKMIEMIM